MRILAVYPEEPELAVFEKMPPLGMLWIGGELRRAGHDVLFLDRQIDSRDPAALAQALRPPLALIGGTTHSRFASFAAARGIKRASPETVVVYGGPHASFTAPDTLRHVPEIDIVVHGEGEQTACDLAAWRSGPGWRRGLGDGLQRIAGVSYRRDGQIARAAPRTAISDLDRLGAPARDLVAMDRYAMTMDYLGLTGAAIMTARGCPIGCSFCSASAMFGRGYRRRSPARVVDEIEALLENGAQGIKVFDSTFTLVREHVEGFCAELQRRRIHVPWECEARVGSVDQRLLATMQEAGCYYLDVGVESGVQRVLDECIHKRIRVADAERLLRWTRALGLLTKVFFTVGHPGETYPEARRTNRFIWRNRAGIRLSAYQAGIKIYPGTEVERFAGEHDLFPRGFRWSAPYTNEVNRQLFRPADNVPLLLQPGLGVRELRRLRIGFIAMRLASARFVYEKLRAILRTGAAGAYLRIIGRGVGRKGRARAVARDDESGAP